MTAPTRDDDFCPGCSVEWRLCDCDEVLAYGFGNDDFDDDDHFIDEMDDFEGDDWEEDEDE